MSATVRHDEQITTAAAGFAAARDAMRAAREHLERARAHVARTQGKAFVGELAALPDLDQAHRQLLDAEHAVQDAQLLVPAAQAALTRLEAARDGIERRESLEHLAALLAHRSAWAAKVDAATDLLAATIRAYLAAAQAADQILGGAGGIKEEWSPRPAGPLIDRVLAVLRQAAPGQFTSAVSPRPPFVESDREMTKVARGRITAAQARGELPAPAAASSS